MRTTMPVFKRLSASEINALFREYRATRSVDLRNHIVEQFLGLAISIGTKIAHRLPYHLEYDEVVSFGMIGLIAAVENYDPDRGVAFTNYATRRINGAIMDELREADWVPRLTRQRVKQVAKASGQFIAENGREPNSEELRSLLNVDQTTFTKITGDTLVELSSITDEKLSRVTGRTERIEVGLTAASEADPAAKLDVETIIRDIVIPRFGLREALILRLYYLDDLTLREIGEALRMSESRISQIHSELIRLLRIHDKVRDRRAA